MKSPTDCTSSCTPWNCLSASPGAGRLYPVVTGSMKTMSVTSKIEDSLSTNLYGGGSKLPASPISTRRGPNAPTCSHNEPAPGPPLNANVIGRFAASFASSFVYATKNTLAFGVPSSSFITIVPAVAVYLISCPLMRTECFVCTVLSSGGFFSSFGFSLVLSEPFSEGFSPAGCCANAKLAPIQKTNATKDRQNRLIIAGKPLEKICTQDSAREIVCDPAACVNLLALVRNLWQSISADTTQHRRC